MPERTQPDNGFVIDRVLFLEAFEQYSKAYPGMMPLALAMLALRKIGYSFTGDAEPVLTEDTTNV